MRLLILLFAITIAACNEESTSIESNTNNLFNVTGVVFDVISKDYSPGVKKDAIIYLDNISTVSDNEGKFEFSKVSPGGHTIKITLANYEPYSNTISVLKDTSISIYLYGIKDNYFPINENTTKTYNYFSSYGGGYPGQDSGRATWTIASSKQVGDSKVYDVIEKIIFRHKTFSPLYSERVDSTTSSFSISENKANVISFKSSVLDGVSFNKYFDSRAEQGGVITLHYNNPGSLISSVNISLKKDVGLTKIVQSGNGWGKTYELIK